MTTTALTVFAQAAVANTATRLTADDYRFHLTALQLSEREAEDAQIVFNDYLDGIAASERAATDFVTWSGRWSKEHLYWMQLQEWAHRIAPQSWSIQPAFEKTCGTLRDRYFTDLQDAYPQKAYRVALLARVASRDAWLRGMMLPQTYPDLVRIAAEIAPAVLDEPEVRDAVAQYELRVSPILDHRKRLVATQRRDFEKAMEDRDVEAIAGLNAAIPLNDRELWLATVAMVDIFASALSDADASAFRDAVDEALHPFPSLISPLDGLIERALNDPSVTAGVKARALQMQTQVEAARERVRGELRIAAQTIFEKSYIERVARQQTESILGLRSDPVAAFDAPYQDRVKVFTEESNRLAVELQEIIGD